jgi:hypothetical protein
VIRRRTIWLAALVAVVAFAVLGAAMVVMLPDIVRRAAVWRLEALTQRRVGIARVDLNVFTGDVAVHGLEIADRDEPVALARVELIKARVHRRSLLDLHVWIDELLVERSSIRIVRFAGNRFNISDLLERPAQPPSRIGVTVDHLRVTDGSVVLEDRTLRPARTWKSERIAIEARNLSTSRADGTADGSTVVAGAPVHVAVEDLRLAPIHLRAHVTVGNVDLALLRLYLPGNAPVLPESGILAAGVTVVHDARDGTVISAGARIHHLALERRGQSVALATSPETLVTLNDLHLKDGGFTLGRGRRPRRGRGRFHRTGRDRRRAEERPQRCRRDHRRRSDRHRHPGHRHRQPGARPRAGGEGGNDIRELEHQRKNTSWYSRT